MRLVERLAVRAGLPLRYSQGFNPHPVLSLLLPRPVGVATRDDPLVLAMDEPLEAQALLDALNAHAPAGMRFFSADRMEGRKAPRPKRAFYELALSPPERDAVQVRLPELQARAAWPAQRLVPSSRGERTACRPIDLRPLVEGLEVEAGRLRMTLVRQGDAWARPGEVLAILGLEGPECLARLVRAGCECEAPAAPASPEAAEEPPAQLPPESLQAEVD